MPSPQARQMSPTVPDADALTAYLTARLDEAEEAARITLDITASYFEGFDTEWKWVLLSKPKRFRDGWSSTFHPGAPAPAAVLADIAAKRAMLTPHAGYHDCLAPGTDCSWTTSSAFRDIVLPALVAPYATRPDFPAGWKIDA